MDEEIMKTFGGNVQRLINKEPLSEEETYWMFEQVLSNSQPDLQQGAFLAALVSKGETAQEIAGAWRAIDGLDTNHVQWDGNQPLFENSGTGMDSLKTFNVSSAAAIVASACGVKMARHGARALTSFCGTVDIMEAVGVDVECDVDCVRESIAKVGIGLFNGMSPAVHPSALGRILSQIRFGSTLNIAASLANPARPRLGLRGVYSEALMDISAEVMHAIGYERGLVVNGKCNQTGKSMDECSTAGKTLVCEFDETGNIHRYSLTPEDVGLRTASFEEIRVTGDLEAETQRFVRVLAGRGPRGCTDFTSYNAGAILYGAGIVGSIREGVGHAQEAIAEGRALAKLKSWVALQNRDPQGGMGRLQILCDKTGVLL